ncbi:MAG: DUF362 domain-containing protein [Anaerolineales bacterium]
MPRLNRREFLRIVGAGIGSAVSGSVFAGCSSPKPAAPTQTSIPSTPAPTSTEVATITTRPKSLRRPEIIKMYPASKSSVIYTHHGGVWSDDTLNAGVLSQMLDTTLTKLTGLNDASESWRALFDPGERIAIKANVFGNSLIWTHYPLVQAVTAGLIKAGIPAEQILIFDALTSEFETAKYPVNPDGPGVRCRGTDRSYTDSFPAGIPYVQLSDLLLQSDALINMPVLKSHMIAGMTFTLKNHFGSTDNPSALHNVVQGIPQLNALPAIKDRTRLVIGDMLEANLKYTASWPYWKADYRGDAILMSYDPLAADAFGFTVLDKLVTASGGEMETLAGMAQPWLQAAASAGLGAGTAGNYGVTEIKLP